MRWLDQAVLPLAVAAVAALAAGAAHRALAPRGTRVTFWLAIALESGLILGALSLVSGWLQALQPVLWQRGWHAHFDLVPGRFGVGRSYAAALVLPLAFWGVLLLVGLKRRARGSSAPGVSTTEYGGGRGWVLAAALPLSLALPLALPRLGGGPGAYPAFAWTTLAVVLVSLVAFAFSGTPSSAGVPAAESAPEAADAEPGEPWPQALRNRGIDLTTLARWPARAPRPADQRRVPAELVAGVENLLAGERGPSEHGPSKYGRGEHGRALLVFGAEDDGGLEAVATAGGSIAERFLRRTLVICPRGATELAADLARFLPVDAPRLAVLERPGEIADGLPIWVATAEAFSETILPRLGSAELAAGVGLIVWWDLHRFSGVPAANLWAVSHRLYRLLAHHGPGDLRTLAFSWRSRHPGAQVERYVRRLLPHAEADRREIHLEPSWRRPTELHLVGAVERFFRLQPELLPDRLHPLVAAAKASLDAAWPTHLALPPAAAGAMTRLLERVPAGRGRLAEALSPHPAGAAARLLALEDREVLALAERVSELGRATARQGTVHVGVATGSNPYAEHVLRTLADQPGSLPTASRRLVAAVGQPRILNRHLLRALAELPGTGASLRRDFLAHEAAVEGALGELHAKGELSRHEVRSLSPERKLRRDFEYQSLSPSDGRLLPFDSAGGELVDVRDSAAAHDRQGVVLRIDAERLLIKAYPHRVFTRDGRRYQVREWHSAEAVVRRGFVECQLEARPIESLRLRRSTLQAIRPQHDRVSFGRPERGLARQLATLRYEEWVDGALQLTRDASGRVAAQPVLLECALPLTLTTSALLLLFPQSTRRAELAALAQALRSLLPVHLGVDEDDLEVVAFGGTAEDPPGMRGLALVELYAGGFGLLEPIAEDGEFLLDLLVRTRAWLSACRCQSDGGCEKCLCSVSSRATHAGQGPSRAAALAALARVLA